jgi:hypothetical protein
MTPMLIEVTVKAAAKRLSSTLAFTAGPPTDTSAHFINGHRDDLTRLRRR